MSGSLGSSSTTNGRHADDGLDAWLHELRDRLERGELAGLAPIDVGYGTGTIPADLTIKIMLADLDPTAMSRRSPPAARTDRLHPLVHTPLERC